MHIHHLWLLALGCATLIPLGAAQMGSPTLPPGAPIQMGLDQGLHHDRQTTAPLSATSYRGEQVREHLREARASYRTGDSAEASRHVIEAVAQLRARAGRMTETHQENDLRDAIERLEKLAGKLERNEVKTEAEFNKALSDAYRELAWHHYREADRLMNPERNRRMPAQPGDATMLPDSAEERTSDPTPHRQELDRETWNHEVNESFASYEAAVEARNEQVDDDTRGVMDTLRSWSGSAAEGAGQATSTAGEALDRWGERLNSYGKDLRERANESTGTLQREHNRDRMTTGTM